MFTTIRPYTSSVTWTQDISLSSIDCQIFLKCQFPYDGGQEWIMSKRHEYTSALTTEQLLSKKILIRFFQLWKVQVLCLFLPSFGFGDCKRSRKKSQLFFNYSLFPFWLMLLVNKINWTINSENIEIPDNSFILINVTHNYILM